MTAKQRVLARHPKAHACKWGGGYYIARNREWPPISGLCMLRSGAWRDAARNLKRPS